MAEASARSLQSHSLCFVNLPSNPIINRKSILSIGSGSTESPTRWETLRLSSAVQRTTKKKAMEWVDQQSRRVVAPVKCAAEGMLIGTGGEWKAEAETSGRLKAVVLTALMMGLCNADRIVMSVAVVPLADKLGWSSSYLGVVQSSFLWGYMVSSMMGGALVDRYGGKRVLGWGVALWSLATLFTPLAAFHSTFALLALRTFFGLAQGVAFPSMSTLLARWFPVDERAGAVGITMAGFHMGNVVGLVVTPLMLSSIGVLSPFILFASLGLLWSSSWSSLAVTNNPPLHSLLVTQPRNTSILHHHPCINSPKLITLSTLGLLLSKLPTWAILFANFTNNWGYFVLLSWMPVYFQMMFNVNLKQAAWFSALPWAAMAVSGYIAGAASDLLITKGHSLTLVRKIMQTIGFVGPGLSLLCLNLAKSPPIAAVLLTAALSLSAFSQAGFLLNIQEIAPEHAGFLHGISNAAGTLGAIVGTMGTGYMVHRLGSFQAFLSLTSSLYFASAAFWLLFSTAHPLF